MYAGKPIIGIAGGIGSGKSYVASLFAAEGCLVLDADAAVRAAYADPAVRAALRRWWGDEAFLPTGDIDRRAIGRRVFADAAERKRLEDLLHPYASADRDRRMSAAANDPAVRGFVWDIPLLFETGLNIACDAIVFVDAPVADRAQRVTKSRNWPEGELQKRELSQYPLDRKRALSDYVIANPAAGDQGSAAVREQVRTVLSQILTNADKKSPRMKSG